MNLTEVGELSNRVLDEVERVVLGKREALELLMLGLLADGHVLIEDYPGLAKTLMARSFAQVTSLDFSRIQFTPDLMPSDVTGSSVFNQREADFEFRPGPIFANLLLADEINRAPPKTQAALLEAMQERQVTTEGQTRRLGPPFLVLATQNPIEYEGTYPLPEAQLDRFLLRMSVGYPAREDEWQMLANRAERGTDELELTPLVDRDTLLAMQAAIEKVYVSEPVGLYMVDIVAATRDAQSIQVGASPRGSLALLKLSRCRAALDGRDYVTPDDVKSVAVPALAHRLTLRPELWVQRVSAEDVVRSGSTRCRRLRPKTCRPDVTRWATPKLAAYAGLSAAGLLSALVFARPELVALTAPFLLALAAGLALATPPRLRIHVELDEDRALEGDEVGARIILESSTAGRPARLLPAPARRDRGARRQEPGRAPPRGGRAPRARAQPCARRAGAATCSGRPTRAPATHSACSSGRRSPQRGPSCASTRARTCSGGCSSRGETQVFTGNEVSRHKGEGIEFADIRPWAAGDPLKRVNWRASARRNELWVNESHPERNTDVILFVDSFAEARSGDEGTLDLAVRATATLANAYVGRRDRVGLICVRRHPALARARDGHGAALPHRRRAARHADRALVLLEGDRRDPAAHAAAERDGDRALTAARRPFGRRAPRSARARLRPRP